jgi:3(or 17)beta-hydroxysteroid dehydrogenase
VREEIMNRLDGKVAIVTGAGRGIGRDTALRIAQAGGRLVVTDVDADAAAETASAIGAAGGEAIGLAHDVTDEQQWLAAIGMATTRFGGFHVLVNNAGIFLRKSIEETTFDEFDRLSRVNVWGTFLGTKLAIREMKVALAQAGPVGSIVNLASAAGIVGSPFGTAYAMTKGTVRLFTRSAAREIGQLGYRIRINAVYPGIIDTPMGEQAMARMAGLHGVGSNQAREIAEKLHLVGRIGEPDDIARAIVFLASDDSEFMTGAELVVDGGFSIR